MFQTKVVEKIREHILCSVTFSENRADCEKMWKNIRWQYGACALRVGYLRLRLHKNTHTHTHRICNTYCFSTATRVQRARLNVTLYVHRLPCYIKQLFSVLELINFKCQRPFRYSKRLSHVIKTLKPVTVFIKSHHRPLSWTTQIHSSLS
jgi:hypothetical protein